MSSDEEKFETIGKNLDTLVSLVKKLELSDAATAFFENNVETLMIAPASTKREFTRSHDGGWVEQTLDVCETVIGLWNLQKDNASGPSLHSLLKLAVVHDIVKVNNIVPNTTYYLPNPSEWHRDNLSIMYKVHEKFSQISPLALTLKMCMNLCVPLSAKEINCLISLQTTKTTNTNEDVVQVDKSWMNSIMQTAVKFATIKGSGQTTPKQLKTPLLEAFLGA